MRQLRVLSRQLGIGSTAIFIVTLALGILAVPLPSDGQQPARIYRIGYLGFSPTTTDLTPQHCPREPGPLQQALREGLREHGYIESQNLVIECRWTEGREEQAPPLRASW
jgi:hypothetical protein